MLGLSWQKNIPYDVISCWFDQVDGCQEQLSNCTPCQAKFTQLSLTNFHLFIRKIQKIKKTQNKNTYFIFIKTNEVAEEWRMETMRCWLLISNTDDVIGKATQWRHFRKRVRSWETWHTESRDDASRTSNAAEWKCECLSRISPDLPGGLSSAETSTLCHTSTVVWLTWLVPTNPPTS